MNSLGRLVWVSKEDYYEAKNVPRAIRRARRVARAMIAGLIDPVVWRAEVGLALEVLCDATPDGPRLALQAIKSVERRFLRPMEWEEPESPRAKAILFACGATTIAEVAHRNGRYREAFIYTSAALDKLEEAALDELRGASDGREALHRLVASSKGGGHPLARPAVAVQGIRVPALRRAAYGVEAREIFEARTEGIVPAYLASGCTYGRTHAFATQVLFEHLEQEKPEHIDDLLWLSTRTRGSTLRALATEPLVEMEYRRAQGDVAGAKRAAEEGLRLIRAFGLYRHLEMIERYGYARFV